MMCLAAFVDDARPGPHALVGLPDDLAAALTDRVGHAPDAPGSSGVPLDLVVLGEDVDALPDALAGRVTERTAMAAVGRGRTAMLQGRRSDTPVTMTDDGWAFAPGADGPAIMQPERWRALVSAAHALDEAHRQAGDGADAGAVVDVLLAKVHADDARHEAAGAAVQAAHESVEQAGAMIDLMIHSRSWKLTAPIRDAGQTFRRVRKLATRGRARGASVAPVWEADYLLSPADLHYASWAQLFDTYSPDEMARMARHAQDLAANGPAFSVVVPVYNTPSTYLRRAIESVRNQIYPRWQLCICDDASTEPSVAETLAEYADDPRIVVTRREANGHISAATNDALALATGAFVAFLDHDDELAPHALHTVAEYMARHPGARLFYSDEDRIDTQGQRFGPHFKPPFNPELLWAQNYITHLTVIDRELVAEAGGLREGFEGSQDHDLVLRATRLVERDQIVHIPHVLYHWRVIPGSVALNLDEKPYAIEAGRRAVEEHVRAEEPGARVDEGDIPGTYRVHMPLPDPLPPVSIIIPTRNGLDVLRACIDSIHGRSTYPHLDIMVVDNGSDDPRTLAYLRELSGRENVAVVPYDKPFNYAAMNNMAVELVSGEYVVLLNNDTTVETPDWVEQMLSWARRPGIGTVGARLLYPDDSLQHVGLTLGIGSTAGHSHKGFPADTGGYFGRPTLVHEVGGNTGACMMIARRLFTDVGGFNEVHLPVAYNDVDLCLRLSAAGYRHLIVPGATLYHHESKSRGSDESRANRERHRREHNYLRWRWQGALGGDPAYNPNLSLDTEAFELAWPPRVGPVDGVTDPPSALTPVDPRRTPR